MFCTKLKSQRKHSIRCISDDDPMKKTHPWLQMTNAINTWIRFDGETLSYRLEFGVVVFAMQSRHLNRKSSWSSPLHRLSSDSCIWYNMMPLTILAFAFPTFLCEIGRPPKKNISSIHIYSTRRRIYRQYFFKAFRLDLFLYLMQKSTRRKYVSWHSN